MAQRLIFHVDVNSAFLSWEAVEALKNGAETDLRTIPSVVGGDPTRRSSIVAAKSIPAKRYGITTGEPVALALQKCPNLTVVPPHFELYRKNSRAFKDIIRKYAPVVEEFSIDECFLDMTGTGLLYPDPMAIAATIRDEIRDTLGFTVNIGIAENKLLAKMASDFEKPDKIHTLFPAEIPAKMWPLPVGDLFTVGKSTAARLNSLQIHTIGDLAAQKQSYLEMLFGERMGNHLYRYSHGMDESPVDPEKREAKSYSVNTTLEENVVDRERAHLILLNLSDMVAFRIRADGKKASCVTVTIRDTEFRDRSHQKQLMKSTDVTTEICRAARELFDSLWDGHTPLRLMSVGLSHVDDGELEQLSFFTDERRERERAVDRTIDDLRSRYGAGIVSRGALMNNTGQAGRRMGTRGTFSRDAKPKERQSTTEEQE